MQAACAYNAGMQYTLRNIPPRLDALIRAKAKEENRSINDVSIEALARTFGLLGEPIKHRDLQDMAGTWREDPECEEVLEGQRIIDGDLWR